MAAHDESSFLRVYGATFPTVHASVAMEAKPLCDREHRRTAEITGAVSSDRPAPPFAPKGAVLTGGGGFEAPPSPFTNLPKGLPAVKLGTLDAQVATLANKTTSVPDLHPVIESLRGLASMSKSKLKSIKHNEVVETLTAVLENVIGKIDILDRLKPSDVSQEMRDVTALVNGVQAHLVSLLNGTLPWNAASSRAYQGMMANLTQSLTVLEGVMGQALDKQATLAAIGPNFFSGVQLKLLTALPGVLLTKKAEWDKQHQDNTAAHAKLQATCAKRQTEFENRAVEKDKMAAAFGAKYDEIMAQIVEWAKQAEAAKAQQLAAIGDAICIRETKRHEKEAYDKEVDNYRVALLNITKRSKHLEEDSNVLKEVISGVNTAVGKLEKGMRVYHERLVRNEKWAQTKAEAGCTEIINQQLLGAHRKWVSGCSSVQKLGAKLRQLKDELLDAEENSISNPTDENMLEVDALREQITKIEDQLLQQRTKREEYENEQKELEATWEAKREIVLRVTRELGHAPNTRHTATVDCTEGCCIVSLDDWSSHIVPPRLHAEKIATEATRARPVGARPPGPALLEGSPAKEAAPVAGGRAKPKIVTTGG